MPAPTVYDQTNCWEGLQNNDPLVLGYLYDTYADKLFEAASWVTNDRDIAKDALQEVFITIWNYRNSLGEIRHPQSYLIKVLHHIIYKKQRSAHLSISNLSAVNDPEQNAEERQMSIDTTSENTTRLRRACTNLTARQQMVIQLRFYDGLSYRQIATKLRMNYQSVNNLVFRTLLSLRRQL